jgi:1,4-dihydroxy-6-naphthoate synthase
MRLAISPCPNDTYLFHAWLAGFVGKDLPAEPYFADIERLNGWALKKAFPLIKLSFHCFSKVVQEYQLLPIGSALGFHCGPKIIAKTFFHPSELSKKKIAIPGEETTAHLLLKLLLPQPKEKLFTPYHEIASLIKREDVDCGLIIHESRFTFKQEGFVEIADLGEIWHAKTGAPLPLGGIAIARDMPDPIKAKIVAILQASLLFARTHPEKGLPFILSYSQEKDEKSVRQHIDTYVTSETECLSSIGISAIETLLHCGDSKNWLYSPSHV